MSASIAIAAACSVMIAHPVATSTVDCLPPVEASHMLNNLYPSPETNLTEIPWEQMARTSSIPKEGARLIARLEPKVPFTRLNPSRPSMGFEVVLINGTDGAIIVFNHSRYADLIQEALDFDGKWKAIESCQDHTITPPAFFVQPGTQWSTVAPIYAGSWPTWLRFRLGTTQGPLYSNVFWGRINPMQFRFQGPYRIDSYWMSRANHGDRILVLQHFLWQ